VIRGSVLAIPIGDRLLYVEPICLQAEHRFKEAALELEQMRALLEQLSGQVDEGD
jgi:uncharacterized membrane protein (UPF0182 family)